jgi:peptidyl-prolyl cis-trans isomerase SurA|tara:strand:- start:262 stop:1200 length:939 start_codon:yes stop_codon:yes gene_type:complete
MNLKIFLIFIFFIITKNNQLLAIEDIKIILKVENEIITNIDLLNEKNYLIALNNEILNLPEEKSLLLAKNSIVKEKIKKNEINNYFNEEYKYEISEIMLKNLTNRIGLNSIEELKEYLQKFNLNLSFIEEKTKNEDMWNRLIYNKYKNQINIDVKELKNRLKIEIKNNNNILTEYNISEIQFNLNIGESLEQKYNQIINSINSNGFKIASNLYSVSETSKFGGKIGWINKTSISGPVLDELEKLNIGEITKPIKIRNFFLILKIEDKKESKIKIDFEKELKKLINFETNKQFNQFSLIYLNKIKQNIFISEQ